MTLKLFCNIVTFEVCSRAEQQAIIIAEDQDSFFNKQQFEEPCWPNCELSRVKRSYVEDQIEDMHPVDQLRLYRDRVFITDEEETQLQTDADVVIFRFMSIVPDENSDNMTVPDYAEYIEGVNEIKTTFANMAANSSVQISDSYAQISYFGFSDLNETIIVVNGVAQVSGGSATDLIKELDTQYTEKGLFGSWAVNEVTNRAFSSVRAKTVYHIFIRLTEVEYLKQYQDVHNAVSLLLADKIILLTREMHRQKFGEFFFQTVILEMIQGPRDITFVSLAILLEPNDYNMVDIDSVWKRKANAGFLGAWTFSNYDYVIKETKFVPTDFQPYLIAKQLRSDLVLDTDEMWYGVAVPSIAGMALVILTIIACSWEGWCCRKFLEDDNCCCCIISV